MQFDKILSSACVNTTTTTTQTTTGLPTSTTTQTTTLATTTPTSTSTTTTCGEQDLGIVSPDIMSSAITNFGTFAAGRYRVAYEYGAMKYRGGGTLKINDEGYLHGFRIVHSSGLSIIHGPGNSDAYGSQPSCEIGNFGAFVEFDHGGGSIGMFLEDGPYTDNAPGTTSNPTFKLISLCGATTTSTTTQTTTTGPTTATTTGTTTTTTTHTTTTTTTTTHTTTTTATTTACPNQFTFEGCNGVGTWTLCCAPGEVAEHNPDYVGGQSGCMRCVATTTAPPATSSTSSSTPP